MVVLWTWPWLVTLASVDVLYLRPGLHIVCFFVLAWVVLFAYAARAVALNREREPLTIDAQRLAWRRVVVLVVASAAITAFHATALPLRLIFLCHLAAFESARAEANATLPPGGTAVHGRIGLFAIVAVERGHADGVAFKLDSQSGFQHGGELLIYNPNANGPLFGGWRWVSTD